MSIKIDYREKLLIEACQRIVASSKSVAVSSLVIDTPNLLLGDVQITGSKSTHSTVVERKTIADLLSSIKDGRYKEQSLRLSADASHHNHNIIYLIEGDATDSCWRYMSSSEKDMVNGAMVSILLLKGFSLYRTKSVHESANFILQVARKLSKTSVSMFYPNASSSASSEEVGELGEVNEHAGEKEEPSTQPSGTKYEETAIKASKKENITPDNIGTFMLSQIPYVGSSIAVTLMDKYGNVAALIEEMKRSPKCLEQLKIQSASGQQRKIGKNARKNLYLYLHVPCEDLTTLN